MNDESAHISAKDQKLSLNHCTKFSSFSTQATDRASFKAQSFENVTEFTQAHNEVSYGIS
jgi:hypothetical protein